jgi:hypothetical protein
MQNYEYKNSQLLNLLEPDQIKDLLGEDAAIENEQQVKDANLALMCKQDQQDEDNLAQIMMEDPRQTKDSSQIAEDALKVFNENKIENQLIEEDEVESEQVIKSRAKLMNSHSQDPIVQSIL